MNVMMPDSIDELWSLLGNHPDAVLYAGGTDVLVKARSGVLTPETLICLEQIHQLKGIREDERTIFVGSGTTLSTILAHPAIGAFLPVLGKAIRSLGSPPIRNMATLGGNICTASPAGDTLPALYVLDADIALWSPHGKRLVPIDRFILGPGKTCLQQCEIVEGIQIAKPDREYIHHFEKVGQRKALSISIASLAALVKTDVNDRIASISLAWGSVGPTIVRSKEVEAALVGQRLTAADITKVLPLVKKAVAPIGDVRASVGYRRTVSANLMLRLAVNKAQQP